MSLALYRKYRPGTFAEVKGQEHVTDPLRQALRTGRINHAYLFSGPRGCGKTSSARILARSLNCEQGPTPDPCGTCESCVALSPTGPGHLDVIEIDAASHGGVDDARDLRERAFFAPVSARYKIYIIDEAHMVTREGFNALLKLVEEPPPHLKFIFATTEPEKVIGTIKSRTHHYPFRLMPPATLRALLEEILSAENVPYEPAALPLVVRAGAGSARDSLSILDQLLAGADDDGITYARAVSLLGYTDGDLLDEVVEAFAARDGAQVFQTVNRVVEGGHDPRRFATDLLERFRDLVILANVPEAASSGLLDRPADELERLVQQASSMGPAELTRAAEIFNAGLTEMRGATSPRLLLELMCARVLLPAAEQGEAALLARLERLERGSAVAGMAARAVPGPVASAPSAPSVSAPSAPSAAPGQPGAPGTVPTPSGRALDAPGSQAQPGSGRTSEQAADDWPEPARPGAASTGGPSGGQTRSGAPEHGGPAAGGPAGHGASAQGGPVHGGPAQGGPSHGGPAHGGSVHGSPAQGGPSHGAPASGGSAYGGPAQGGAGHGGPAHGGAAQGGAAGGAAALHQQWPAVLAALKQRSIVVWANVSTNAQVVGVEGNLVTLGFTQIGAMKNFTGGGKDTVVATALADVLGGTWRVEAVVGNGPPPSRGGSAGPSGGGAGPGGTYGGAPAGSQGGAPAGAPSGGTPAGAPSGGAPAGAQGGAPAGAPGGPAGAQGAPAGAQGWGASAVAQGGASAGVQGGGPEAQGGSAPGAQSGGAQGSSDGDGRSGAYGGAAGEPGAGGGQAVAGRPTTDESWPSAPDDAGLGSPPMPDPGQAAPAGAGLAAARSAARAAAQAGPRVPASRSGGGAAGRSGGGAAGWPSAVPRRGSAPDADDVDPLNDADADVDELSGMALLQRELGAQVIEEIDHS